MSVALGCSHRLREGKGNEDQVQLRQQTQLTVHSEVREVTSKCAWDLIQVEQALILISCKLAL